MDSRPNDKSFLQPKTLAELLPSLKGIISKDLLASMKKRSQPAMASTRKSFVRPKTMAEMSLELSVLRGSYTSGPTRKTQALPAKKMWNSSVKVAQKHTIHTGAAAKQKSARKGLYQQATSIAQVKRTLNMTPQLPKPELAANKLPRHAKSCMGISGINVLPPTPANQQTTMNSRRITVYNKENVSQLANGIKSLAASQKVDNNIKQIHRPIIPETPSNNTSNDASFLQREKEINDEQHKNTTFNDPTLENIAEVSPPVSTPFQNYRSVHEYFMHESIAMDESGVEADNTIMLFENPSTVQGKRDDSNIVSLCNLLEKASVSSENKPIETCKELNKLLNMEREALNNIEYINKRVNFMNNRINLLQKVKDNQDAALENIRRLISLNEEQPDTNIDKTLVMEDLHKSIETEITITKDSMKTISVIKTTRSPSYTIPKKEPWPRKKLHKSMPNSLNVETPNKISNGNRAISMYWEMKEKMNFLNTPMSKKLVPNAEPDTPAIISRNLQMQLDRLYNES